MTAPISITTMPKWKKYTLLGLILVIAIGVIYLVTTRVSPVKSFTNNYAITRTCDFVTVGNITGAFCNDGSKWQVSAINPLVP